MWWMPIAGLGMATGGGLSTALLNKEAQEKTNAQNAAEAQKNRDFQRHMASTAYQRAMNDMRAAGLNPMLAYQQGGAATPSGSQAQYQPASMGPGIEKAFSNLTSAAQVSMDAMQTRSQVELQGAQALAQVAQAESATASAEQARQNSENTALDNAKLRAQLPAVKQEAQIQKQMADMDKGAAKYNWWRKQIEDTVSSAQGMINPFNWFGPRRNAPAPKPKGPKNVTKVPENAKVWLGKDGKYRAKWD